MSIINIFGWHSHFGEDARPSAMKAFVEPLKQYSKVNTIPLGQTSYQNFDYNSILGQPIVFWGMRPNLKLLENSKHNITWVPMYDSLVWNTRAWWKKIPKNLKIIAYSKKIADLSERCGLKTLTVKFYFDPKNFKQVDWEKGNKIFYWNRSGLLTKEQIERLCLQLNAKTIVFRDRLDFYAHYSQSITLGESINETRVVHMEPSIDHKNYIELLSRCNIFVVPRIFEGIGLTFLEAMASGMLILSPNNPTMNEYISHKKNGILLPFKMYRRNYNRMVTKMEKLTKIKLAPISVLPKHFSFQELNKLPLKEIANRARFSSKNGYTQWTKTLPLISNFIEKKI